MKKSLYQATESRVEKINNLGFNYEGKILRRTLSNYLYRDSARAGFLDQFERILFFLVEKVKTIKTYYNYTIPKDYRKFN